ncbi:MAG TPA: hypothetical protein VKB69_12885 [Micromonosporaceae bacterium]|nr:hypothetical protein [Micromonosporaceae bacterium]
MSRNKAAIATATCLLALVTGCAGKSGANGSGALQPQPSSTPTGTASGKPTTAPPTAKPPGTQTPKPAPSGDCDFYDPNNLTVDGSGATGTFVIEDGSTVVIRVHGQDDQVGQQALALAQRWKMHCYIGRNNTMDPKGDFIFDYWLNPSGKTPPIPGEDDLCSPYNNTKLTVEDMGSGQGWRVKDHDHVLHLFATKFDAQSGDAVLAGYSQVCAIGDVEDADFNLGQVDFQR